MASHPPSAPAEVRHLRGVSTAVKLAALIAGVMALFMLVFGAVFSRFVEDTVREQIHLAAVESARTAATADLDAWSSFFGTAEQGLTPEQVQSRVAGMTPFEFRAFDSAERRALLEWNGRRLQRALGSGSRILAIEVERLRGGQRQGLVAASYDGQRTFAPLRGVPPVAYDEGQAVAGVFTRGGLTHPVIRGSYPLVDRKGEPQGEVAVYILASAVDEATADVRLKVAYGGILFVTAGAALAYLVGKLLLRPLHLLKEDIRIVASGDLDHHTRPHGSDEIAELARSFDQMTSSLAVARDTERQAAASRREMAVAMEVTAGLRPTNLPTIPGFDVAALAGERAEPAAETWDVLAMPGGRRGFLVAAANGTGVPAALVLAMGRAYLRVLAADEADPAVVLRRGNERLSGDLLPGMFVSVLLVVLDPASARLRFASAGHPPLLHWSAGEQRLTPLHSEGIALGFDEGPVFDRTLRLGELSLQPGDRVVLYAPGLLRLAAADGRELGEGRLLTLVRREAPQGAAAFVRRVEATLRKWHGQERFGVDVTLLTMGRPVS